MSKYNNKKSEYNGIKFDSVKEMKYYIKLKELLDKNEISNLELQKEYILQDKFKLNNRTIRKISYVADFYYIDKDGNEHIVDTKGYRTEVYLLKKKLFEYKYQKEIEEV